MKVRNLIATLVLLIICAGPMLAKPSNTSESVSNSAEPAQGTEVDSLAAALMGLLSSRASQYSAKLDVPQAKMFHIGQTSAAIAPVEAFSLNDLGLLGILEVGGPFKVKDTELPPGSYRMEIGGTLQQMLLYFRDSFGNRVVSIPVEITSNTTLGTSSNNSVSANRWRWGGGGGSNPVGPLRVYGPNISINFTLIRQAPYVSNVTTCAGFVIPFSSGAFNLKFCF